MPTSPGRQRDAAPRGRGSVIDALASGREADNGCGMLAVLCHQTRGLKDGALEYYQSFLDQDVMLSGSFSFFLFPPPHCRERFYFSLFDLFAPVFGMLGSILLLTKTALPSPLLFLPSPKPEGTGVNSRKSCFLVCVASSWKKPLAFHSPPPPCHTLNRLCVCIQILKFYFYSAIHKNSAS